MKIHELHDDQDRTVIAILEEGLSSVTNEQIIKNYHPDYRESTGNLFYILKQGRYRHGHGKYYVVTVDDKYVCSAGWNEYDLEPEVAIVLSRMFIVPEYRGQYLIGKNVLPMCIEETVKYNRVWITANDHNRSIYDYFERASTSKRTALFNDWPPIYRQFKPLGRRSVYYTDQWVAELNRTQHE